MGNSVPSGGPSNRDLRTHLEDPGLEAYALIKPLLAVQPRFLKSIQCQHPDGLVVLKVYVKLEPTKKRSAKISTSLLRRNQIKLERLRNLVNPRTMPNILPYQRLYESKKYQSVFLIRQYLKNNLYDRLTSLPTLTHMEQRFIAYQLLQSLHQIHRLHLYHGDIKSENVLLTSTNWVYLTDFAAFKPTLLPDNDPAGYYYFFENKGERSTNPCYLAPERFYTPTVGRSSVKVSTTVSGGSGSGSGSGSSHSTFGASVRSGSDSTKVLPVASPPLSPTLTSRKAQTIQQLPLLEGGTGGGNGGGGNGGGSAVSEVGSDDFRLPIAVVTHNLTSTGTFSSSSTSLYNRTTPSTTMSSAAPSPSNSTRSDSTNKDTGPRNAPLTAAMDIFAMGCVVSVLLHNRTCWQYQDLTTTDATFLAFFLLLFVSEMNSWRICLWRETNHSLI